MAECCSLTDSTLFIGEALCTRMPSILAQKSEILDVEMDLVTNASTPCFAWAEFKIRPVKRVKERAWACDAPLRPLIYPLVQVTLGALRLIPTATYFPLRFQLTRSLLRLSRTTGTFIPLAAPLYEVLNSAEMRKAPKPSTLKPLDFDTSIRVAKSYLRTRTYQDRVGEQVHSGRPPEPGGVGHR